MSEVTNAAGTGRRFTVMGVLVIILGMLAMLLPMLTGWSIAMLLGGLMVGGGIVRLISMFHAGGLGKGLFQFLVAVLTILCGGALIANPLFAAEVLTMLLMLYFILDGIFELGIGLKARPVCGWLIFSGIISLLLGVMIWSQRPLSGFWVLGIFLGIKLFFVGLTMITTGSVIRHAPNA